MTSNESLHVNLRNSQPLVSVRILQPLAKIVHWSHRVGSSIKEEHSLAYVYLPPSRKVPDSLQVIGREVENQEDDPTVWGLD